MPSGSLLPHPERFGLRIDIAGPASDRGLMRRPQTGRCARSGSGGSAEAAGDVVLGLRVAGGGEDLLGVVDLDQTAGVTGAGDVEEADAVGGPGGRLHIVGGCSGRG